MLKAGHLESLCLNRPARKVGWLEKATWLTARLLVPSSDVEMLSFAMLLRSGAAPVGGLGANPRGRCHVIFLMTMPRRSHLQVGRAEIFRFSAHHGNLLKQNHMHVSAEGRMLRYSANAIV